MPCWWVGVPNPPVEREDSSGVRELCDRAGRMGVERAWSNGMQGLQSREWPSLERLEHGSVVPLEQPALGPCTACLQWVHDCPFVSPFWQTQQRIGLLGCVSAATSAPSRRGEAGDVDM